MERTFDRLPEFDERSRAFSAAPLVEAREPRSYTWRCDTWLNQGSEGACVGFAWTHEAAARPVVISGLTNDNARFIYHEAQKVDEWPGEDYSGTSVLAGAKVARTVHWCTEYRWCFTLLDTMLVVGYRGPVVLGINWHEGMSYPDNNGFIHAEGEIVGGHAILCHGYSVTKKAFKLHNSWGTNWGINGECWLPQSDLAALLKAQGEVCVPLLRTYG